MPLSTDPRAIEARRIRDESLQQDVLLSAAELASCPRNVLEIPRSCGKLTEGEIALTEDHDATALLQMLREGHVTATELLTAFIKRASIAQQLTNCITELLPEASKAARDCDDFLRDTGRTMGPLHGLPVSVKEQFTVGSHYTNCSFVAWADHWYEEDCELVKTLRGLGAVVFARTMQPQTVMHLECDNTIYGSCACPYDRSKSVGGSSGGEAALMALCGTPLGFGGDIGGSIRAPAANNGLYGFKPSSTIVTSKGVIGILPGADSIVGSLGPFTRSKRDLDLVTAAYSSAAVWTRDPGVARHHFHTLEAKPSLVVGILQDPSLVQPSDEVQSVLQAAVYKLEASSAIRLVTFSGLDHQEVWPMLQPLYFEGCEKTVEDVLKQGNEPLLPLTKWILNSDNRKDLTTSELQKLKAARDRYRRRYGEYWDSTGVDVVLSVVATETAPAPSTSKYWMYTALWNLLDYPALTFPASRILGPAASSNMPVGLQLIAKRWQDNELLAALGTVETVLRS